MKRVYQILVVCTSLILSLGLPGLISASGPEKGLEQGGGELTGLASTTLACLAAGDDSSAQASGAVSLTWQGQAEQARLILNVSGAEAAHTIKVNGQAVAQVPIYPEGQPCGEGEVFYLDLPPELVVQGDNLIEITNDALASDDWTAAYVRLEVLGDIAIIPTTEPTGPGPVESPDISSSGFPVVYELTLDFTSSYDGSTQEFKAQIPVPNINDCKTASPPVPLVLYLHGRSSSMDEPFTNGFADAPKNKGWLLAAPQYHGSWPTPPDPPGKFAYASLESQYDVIDTVNYMVEKCNVKLDQIYLYGNSMGGQTDTIVAAKFPHIFAAIFDNKGPTDMAAWYDPLNEGAGGSFHRDWMEQECHIGGVPKAPDENPFCYQRRSGLNFASNYIHKPISMTHSVADELVGIYHSRKMRDAINSYGPDQLASVYEDTVIGPTCGAPFHCYVPDPDDVLDFLEPFTLNNTPTHINVTTDESKSYYWLNMAQTGGDHWSQVEATYYPLTSTVKAIISDTNQLDLAFNLGSTPIAGVAGILQPGMGLPATTYLVNGGGKYELADYTSGYMTSTLNSGTSPFNLTISAVTAQVSTDPTIIGIEDPNATVVSTIKAIFKDQLGNSVPDGTAVQFSTPQGTFPNGNSTYTTTTTGGQATATLTLGPGLVAGQVKVSATVESVTGFASIDLFDSRTIYLPVVVKDN